MESKVTNILILNSTKINEIDILSWDQNLNARIETDKAHASSVTYEHSVIYDQSWEWNNNSSDKYICNKWNSLPRTLNHLDVVISKSDLSCIEEIKFPVINTISSKEGNKSNHSKVYFCKISL